MWCISKHHYVNPVRWCSLKGTLLYNIGISSRGGGPPLRPSFNKNRLVSQTKKKKTLTGKRKWAIALDTVDWNGFQTAWWATWVPTEPGRGMKRTAAGDPLTKEHWIAHQAAVCRVLSDLQ